MKRKTVVYLSVALMLFGACSHSNEEMFLPTATIIISSPTENTVIHFGDTVHVQGTAFSQSGLYGYEVAIRKVGGANLYFQHHHEQNNTLKIDEKWKDTITQTADMELEISAITDAQEHKQIHKVRFKAQQ